MEWRWCAAGRGLGCRPRPRAASVHSCERAGKVTFQRSERARQRLAARDDDIIAIAPGLGIRQRPQNLAEASADPIALDGIADLLRDGEAEPRAGGRDRYPSRLALEHERRGGRPRSSADALELNSSLQGYKPHLAQSPPIGPAVRPPARKPASVRTAIRPTAASGPWRDDGGGRARRQAWPCACEIHGGACARAGSADRSASRQSPSGNKPPVRHSRIVGDRGLIEAEAAQVNEGHE